MWSLPPTEWKPSCSARPPILTTCSGEQNGVGRLRPSLHVGMDMQKITWSSSSPAAAPLYSGCGQTRQVQVELHGRKWSCTVPGECCNERERGMGPAPAPG